MSEERKSIVYLVPTRKCNLTCAHCDISRCHDEEDNARFMEAFREIGCDNCILFGGEPLLLERPMLDELLCSGKVRSISTNLLLLDTHVLDKLVENGVSVATSWNRVRFHDDGQFEQWLCNIGKLLENSINVTILITLTEDLVDSTESTKMFFRVLDRLSDLVDTRPDKDHFKGVRFEPFVQSTEELIKNMDELMVDVYRRGYKFTNILAEDYKCGNIHNCSEIRTLIPNGHLVRSCPHNITDCILKECLTCKYSKVCKPCKKQKVCTFFRKFFEEVNHGNKSTVL